MKLNAVILAIFLSTSSMAFAANDNSCEHGGACPGENGGGNNGGNGGSGGNGGNGGSATSSAAAVAGSSSGATGGSATASVSGTGGAATNGAVSNSVTTGSVRSLSLGAASVGAPDNGTCVAYLAVGFGLVTSPVVMESCAAMKEALLLDQFGLRDAAIARLCQLKSIQETGICQPRKAE